jgi:hypothetical protein
MAEVDVIPTLGSECKVRDICISSPASSLVHMQWVTDRQVTGWLQTRERMGR